MYTASYIVPLLFLCTHDYNYYYSVQRDGVSLRPKHTH